MPRYTGALSSTSPDANTTQGPSAVFRSVWSHIDSLLSACRCYINIRSILQYHGTLKDEQGCPAARQHPHDGRRLRADDRDERPERDELPHHGDSSPTGSQPSLM